MITHIANGVYNTMCWLDLNEGIICCLNPQDANCQACQREYEYFMKGVE